MVADTMHRFGAVMGQSSEITPATESAIRALEGGGQPLSQSERAFFEPRFGVDFSQVQVHTSPAAAQSARDMNANAYTVGHNVVFGTGQFVPGTHEGKRLIAHELTHVVQQIHPAPGALGWRLGTVGVPGVSASATPSTGVRVQRLVRQSLLMGCGAGQNPFTADRRASQLLTNALAQIDAALAARPGDPANADVETVGNAMHTAFRLDPANDDNWNLPAPHFGLRLIRRRLEIARDYIDSVVFTFNCCAMGGACLATCVICDTATARAGVCDNEPSTITLCAPFWALDANQRGRTLVHEVLHINFGFIEDWAQPDRANAHCYDQFTALLNGFNAPPAARCH